MQINLGTDAGATLDDPDNFQAFSIAVPSGMSAPALESLVQRSGVGGLDADGAHVHVDIDAIRRLALGRGRTWDAGFAAMIAYARTKGWVDDDGNTVRAHVDPH